MKRVLIALALLAAQPSAADTFGMAAKMQCATFVDFATGAVPATVEVNAYVMGLMNGVAIAHGGTLGPSMKKARFKLIDVCREHPGEYVSIVFDEHVTTETFK